MLQMICSLVPVDV